MQHATNDDAVMFDAAWAHGLEKVSVLLRQGGQAAGLSGGCGCGCVSRLSSVRGFYVGVFSKPTCWRTATARQQKRSSKGVLKLVFGFERDKSQLPRSPRRRQHSSSSSSSSTKYRHHHELGWQTGGLRPQIHKPLCSYSSIHLVSKHHALSEPFHP